MGLTQKEAARELGINAWTVLNWEKGRTEPPIVSIPSIVQFLEYDPFPKPKTLPECLLTKRREMGWWLKDAAKAVDVDPGTWGNWERGQTILHHKHRAFVAKFLDLSVDTLSREMTLRWILSD